MKGYIKESHTTIFTGPTVSGKTHLILDLIEKEYKKHFDYVIIICPALQWNKTYHSKDWIKNDDKVWLIEPRDRLYQWIEKFSELLERSETRIIIGDIIVDEDLDNRGQSLLEFVISGRHWDHYLRLLTQSFSAIPKNVRRQTKAIFVSYPKEMGDLKMIHDKNNVLTDDVMGFFKNIKTCMFLYTK